MKHRILVVEDNLANRELLCDWLDSEGFEVESVENLEQSVAALTAMPPRACRLARRTTWIRGRSYSWRNGFDKKPELQRIPVIAVTAHAMLTDQERVLQAGCNACVSKPIDFKLLSHQLDTWLSHAVK